MAFTALQEESISDRYSKSRYLGVSLAFRATDHKFVIENGAAATVSIRKPWGTPSDYPKTAVIGQRAARSRR